MFIYKMGYYSYEESNYHEFLHEREFTQKQFEDMFIEAVLQILIVDRKNHLMISDCAEGQISMDDNKFYRKQLKKHYNKENITDKEIFNYCKKHGNLRYTHFSHIDHAVSDLMVEKFGFKRVKYTAEVAVDGWGGIVDKKRSFGSDDIVLNKITNKFWRLIKKIKNEKTH
jgi:hypothetical protein